MSMYEYLIGKEVEFVNQDKHCKRPDWYPEVGTSGVVIEVDDSLDDTVGTQVRVRWESMSTSEDDVWWCLLSDVDVLPSEYIQSRYGSTYDTNGFFDMV